jgi:hypothetical protein
MAETEAEGIALYIQHLEARAAGDFAAADLLLQASVKLGEPMALHAAAFRATRVEVAVALYTAAADAGFAASAWNLYLHYSDAGDGEGAARWLERAAVLGDQDAVDLLSARSD